MKTKTEMHKSHLSRAMSACVRNGQRLHEDAEWLGSDRSATAIDLCILAQEEFAKAFLLHLVGEGIIPWTAKVRESLRNHKHKQLVGLIMEWLSPSDDEFSARIARGPGDAALPVHVADAM
ncbi:MAG: AbiV family abortive infection protein, partial [Deltaproteobacteria bacterium]|nr:AbiV family abortive infection protein [Deltaproteobacteria bacterium]